MFHGEHEMLSRTISVPRFTETVVSPVGRSMEVTGPRTGARSTNWRDPSQRTDILPCYHHPSSKRRIRRNGGEGEREADEVSVGGGSERVCTVRDRDESSKRVRQGRRTCEKEVYRCIEASIQWKSLSGRGWGTVFSGGVVGTHRWWDIGRGTGRGHR